MNKIPFYPDSIPIVFSANNYYIPYTATTMQSIMENADNDRRYYFFVLYQEIDANYIDLLIKQISNFPQFSIEFINVSQYIKDYNFYISAYITTEAYFRLLIPYIFSEYQKVIYLDGDMICRTDIASLFNTDITNYLIAAVRDCDATRYYNSNTYFNSGLVIFNTILFRETISSKELLELAQSQDWQYHDQDVLNSLAEGKTFFLPYHWNFISMSLHAKFLPENLQNQYNDADKNAYIIHFTQKPWKRGYYYPNFEYFWKYAARTPFIEIIIERMKKEGFITVDNFSEQIISNIMCRKGIGLRFILFDCVKAWLFRNKTKKIQE